VRLKGTTQCHIECGPGRGVWWRICDVRHAKRATVLEAGLSDGCNVTLLLQFSCTVTSASGTHRYAEMNTVGKLLRSMRRLDQSPATFFSPAAYPHLSKTDDGTPQNVSRKRGTKLNMTVNVCLHISACPVRMQTYGDKTLRMLVGTIGDDPVCVCVCVLRFLSSKDKELHFYNCKLQIYSFLWNLAIYLETCGGTQVAEHWVRG
jgi:hypothetical protein